MRMMHACGSTAPSYLAYIQGSCKAIYMLYVSCKRFSTLINRWLSARRQRQQVPLLLLPSPNVRISQKREQIGSQASFQVQTLPTPYQPKVHTRTTPLSADGAHIASMGPPAPPSHWSESNSDIKFPWVVGDGFFLSQGLGNGVRASTHAHTYVHGRLLSHVLFVLAHLYGCVCVCVCVCACACVWV